jgi:integrase
MAIQPAPKPGDSKSRCTRWRVILYNPHTHKQEWYTHNGTKRDAQNFERDCKTKLAKGTYIPRSKKTTVAQLIAAFMTEAEARARRTTTISWYKSTFTEHLLKDPAFATREIMTLQRNDFTALFNKMSEDKVPASIINRCIVASKALLFFALDQELVERNVLHRFKQYKKRDGDTGATRKRGAFSETEVRAILNTAHGMERPFIGLLVLAGLRPGEALALRGSDLDLEAPTARITRSWDYAGGVFVEPKTAAGVRLVPLASWLVAELRAHIQREGIEGEALLFATRSQMPMNLSNVHRDIWTPLLKRAEVRKLDLYSLRHTFATLARSSGENAFNTSRAMGHSKSTLVDEVYAHSLASGVAGVAAGVAARVFPQDISKALDGASKCP